MLGSGGKDYTDLDRASGFGGGTTTSGTYAGPTSTNIDLANLNFDTGAAATSASFPPNANADANDGPLANDAGNPPGGINSNLYDFEYAPTPFNPAKTDRCLAENIVMSVVLVLNMLFGIASVTTVQLKYREANLGIQISAGTVSGCLVDECNTYLIHQVFCGRYMNNSAGYLACIIIAIVFSLIAFIFSICSAFGRACISKYLVVALAIVAWIFYLVSVICVSTLRTAKLCNGVSLGKLGFKYGPAFPLVLTTFILHSLNITFYFFMRCKRPVRYRYN